MWMFVGALAILIVAGASGFVIRRARWLKARHEAVLAVDPQADLTAEVLLESKAALFHGSRFEDGAALLLPAWSVPCVGELFCTKEALFLRREPLGLDAGRMLVWPIAWMDEALLVRGFAPLAGKELPMLRLRFRRGGEALVSEFSLQGGMASLEKLRRLLHVSGAQGATLVQLARFALQGPTPPLQAAPTMDRTPQLLKFVEKDPDNAFPRYALAMERRSHGDRAGAILELQALLARKADYVPAYLMLGTLLHQEGRNGEAREIFTRGQGPARTQGNKHALSELTSSLEGLE